jgi:hypothetical protein
VTQRIFSLVTAAKPALATQVRAQFVSSERDDSGYLRRFGFLSTGWMSESLPETSRATSLRHQAFIGSK